MSEQKTVTDFKKRLPVSTINTKVNKLADDMKENLPKEQIKDIQSRHHFGDGQYLRETFLEKDTITIGKMHRYKDINVLLKGSVTIFNGEDCPLLFIEAPAIWTSKAGVQKIVYTHEDTLWLNPHPTDETDIKLIEKQFIISREEQEKGIEWDGDI